jgi:hypothetical protein
MVPDVDKKPEAKYDNKQTLIQKLKQIVAKMKLKKEAFALKDKAGNVQYAKDNAEASDIKNQARLKGVMLKQTTV